MFSRSGWYNVNMYIEWDEVYTKRLVVGIVLTILALVALIAFFKGRDIARSKTTLLQVAEEQRALQNFFKDNDRYPSESELSSPDFIQAYFGGVTPLSLVSKKCPLEAGYTTFDRQSYTISFCLPRAYKGFLEGVHEVGRLDDLSEYLQ